MFAVVPDLIERVILTPHIVSLLRESSKYVVMAVGVDRSLPINEMTEQCDLGMSDKEDVTNEGQQAKGAKDKELNVSSEPQLMNSPTDFFDVESTESKSDEGIADNNTLLLEQQKCHSLTSCWQQAKQNKNNFFIDNNLLYHSGEIMGHKVNQLCLPESRIGVVLRVAHDAHVLGIWLLRQREPGSN